jgi:hypothetical protein
MKFTSITLALAAALLATTASATMAVKTITHDSGPVQFTETSYFETLDYSLTNLWEGETIVAFAISTGPGQAYYLPSGKTSREGWSAQLLSKGAWQDAAAGFSEDNPFRKYASVNSDFAQKFNAQDQNVAMFWLSDAGVGTGISYQETASGFYGYQVFAASDIVAMSASGNLYKSGGITASIPEPSTYALMAACLGVVAMGTRRRA